MTMPQSAPNPTFFGRWWPRRSVRSLIRPDGERLRDALAREERAGYRYVLYGWLFALLVVSLYLLATIPLSRTVYYLGIILIFAVVGLTGEWIRRAWPRRAGISMGAILLVQISLLTAVLIVPDPLIASQAPPQIAFRTANFLYLYAFVIGTVLSYSPVLMLWAGFIAVVDWSISFWIVYRLPDTVSRGRTSLLDLPDLTLKERLAIFLDPHYMSFVIFRTQVLLLLLTSAILAFAVWRSRRLVLRQMVAESAHANLARYFSPDIVDELAAGSYAIELEPRRECWRAVCRCRRVHRVDREPGARAGNRSLAQFPHPHVGHCVPFWWHRRQVYRRRSNGDLRNAAKARRRRRAPVRLRLRDDRRDRPLERKARAARCNAGARRDRHSLRSGGARQCRWRALSRIHCHRRHRQCGQPSRTPDPRPRVCRGGKPRGDRSIERGGWANRRAAARFQFRRVGGITRPCCGGRGVGRLLAHFGRIRPRSKPCDAIVISGQEPLAPTLGQRHADQPPPLPHRPDRGATPASCSIEVQVAELPRDHVVEAAAGSAKELTGPDCDRL